MAELDRGEPPAAGRARPRLVARARGGARRSARACARRIRARSSTSSPVLGRQRSRREVIMNAVRRGRTRLFALFLLLWGAVVVGAPRPGADRAGLALPRAARSASRSGGSRSPARAARSSTARAASWRSPSRRRRSTRSPTTCATPRAAAAGARADARDAARGGAASALEPSAASSGSAARSTADAADAVRALKLPGIHFVAEPKRFYPKGQLAARGARLRRAPTTRASRASSTSTTGPIRGKPGEIVALTDARRSRYGEAETASSRPAQEGASLVLSLDSGVQFAAEHELAAAMIEHRAKSGSVVVIDPWNGEILAMASAPDFDPERVRQVSARTSRRNRAIADAYEPGSTFKIVTGALAARRGPRRAGRDHRHGRRHDPRREHDDPGGRPPSLRRADARRRLRALLQHRDHPRRDCASGPRRLLRRRARRFGVGQPTGVDLPGENSGIFRPLPRWSALSNA